jgi:hypothetical protein
MIAAVLDQRTVVFKRRPGFFLTKLWFWLIVGGAVSTALTVLVFHGIAGLCQRIFVLGIILWLANEAQQLFWIAVGPSQAPDAQEPVA